MAELDESPYFQADFPPAEFQRRRAGVASRIGDAVAILQGLPETGAFALFRHRRIRFSDH